MFLALPSGTVSNANRNRGRGGGRTGGDGRGGYDNPASGRGGGYQGNREGRFWRTLLATS
jgi:hypothetical protein